jgi:DNA-binding phage protein
LAELEGGAIMSRKLNNSVSHDEREIEELKSDPGLATAYLQIAMRALDDASGRSGGLIMLRAIAAAYDDGLDELAERAGVNREALHCALLPEQQAVK